jgi:hypothetical protein
VTDTDGEVYTGSTTVHVYGTMVPLVGTAGNDAIDVYPGLLAQATDHLVVINGTKSIRGTQYLTYRSKANW